MAKEAYQYKQYLYKAGLDNDIYVIPFVHYIKPKYQRNDIAYEFLKSADECPADDFFKIKSESFRDHIDLVVDTLGRRDRITYGNLMSLRGDLMDIYQAKVQLDDTHFHTQSQSWQNIFKQELEIKRQIRSELKEMYKDTSRASEELRNALLEYKIKSQKQKLFSIEDALD